MLDRKRPYGRIHGTAAGPGAVNAAYEQRGEDGKTRFYNSQLLEVDPQTGVAIEEPPRRVAAQSFDRGDVRAYRELLAKADEKPFKMLEFATAAAALLGEIVPTTKAGIVDRLQARMTEIEEAQASGASGSVGGVSQTGGTVDLAAWARAEANYIFSDVAQVIRENYAREVTTIADALDCLVELEIVAEDEVKRAA